MTQNTPLQTTQKWLRIESVGEVGPTEALPRGSVHKHLRAALCAPRSWPPLENVCETQAQKRAWCQWLCSRAEQQVRRCPRPELMACSGTCCSPWHAAPQQILGEMFVQSQLAACLEVSACKGLGLINGLRGGALGTWGLAGVSVRMCSS